MTLVEIFVSLLALGSVYVVAKGGAPERIVALSFLVAFTLSYFLQQPETSRFGEVEWGILAVDLGLLGILIAVALYADRFWPLWVAALHALSTGGHFVRGMDHGIEPFAYNFLLASWSYPMVLLLVMGTYRHAQRRRAEGYDLDWTPTWHPRAG